MHRGADILFVLLLPVYSVLLPQPGGWAEPASATPEPAGQRLRFTQVNT